MQHAELPALQVLGVHRGGGFDGLEPAAVNGNQGAESTLAVHRAAQLLDAAGLPAVLRQRTRETAAATA